MDTIHFRWKFFLTDVVYLIENMLLQWYRVESVHEEQVTFITSFNKKITFSLHSVNDDLSSVELR
jgi:hypothetical protein